MSIASYRPACSTDPSPGTGNFVSDAYKTITKCSPKVTASLSPSALDGTPWTVTYYSQQYKQQDGLQHLDVYNSPSYQALTKIQGWVLRVTEGLSSDIDPDTLVARITGSSLMYNIVTPNIGDVFTATAGSDDLYLFRITQVTPVSYLGSSHYTVSYVASEVVDTSLAKYKDLVLKVVESYVFDAAAYDAGGDPLVTDVVYATSSELCCLRDELFSVYLQKFIDPDTDFITLIHQGFKIYDPNVSDFIHTIGETANLRGTQHIRRLATNRLPKIADYLYDRLLYPARQALVPAIKTAGLVSRSQFSKFKVLTHIGYTPIDYLVTTDDTATINTVALSYTEVLGVDPLDLVAMYTRSYSTPVGEVPIIKPVLIDDGYVLSMDYYDDTGLKSLLELLVLQHQRGETLAPADLMAVYKDYVNWNTLEQFYYTPLLFLLTQTLLS